MNSIVDPSTGLLHAKSSPLELKLEKDTRTVGSVFVSFFWKRKLVVKKSGPTYLRQESSVLRQRLRYVLWKHDVSVD